MSRLVNIVPALALAFLLVSCEAISKLIHDDEVVARIEKHVLTRSQLEAFIPDAVSPEDSASLAKQYINSWATEILFMKMAEDKLSKSEKDVTDELEDYRRSLLKFRYEQHYINDRLDTNVTHGEIEKYYSSHKDMFVLDVPVVKARFLDIMKDSPDLDVLKSMMSSSDFEDLSEVDSIAYKSALKYEDHSDEWMDMVRFARYFGKDYGTLLSKLGSDGYISLEDERGDMKIGYVCDIRRTGSFAPIEYCEPRIKDIIISNRKHALVNTLEQDLLDDALDNEKLIIY